mgnify:CR=1 FL=1
MSKVDLKKVREVMLYLTQKEGGKIEFKKLLKLTYLADRLHLRQHGRTVSTDFYVAMKKGPVASMTYDFCKAITSLEGADLGEKAEIRSFFEKGENYYTVKSSKTPDLNNFSESEVESMNAVYDEYGSKNGEELSALSHTFHEWAQFRSQLEKNPTAFPIDFSSFFEAEDKGTIFEESKERLEVMEGIYQEDNV